MPSVQQRPSRWGTRYFVRFRAYGAETSRTFATPGEAETFARDVENRGGEAALTSLLAAEDEADSMTLAEWAERHFDSLTDVGPAALRNYRRDWETKWRPHLGHLPLHRITREHVARALNAQTGADKTIRNAWGVLTGILRSAVLDGHLARSPATGIKPGRRTDHEAGEHRYLDAAELRQVIDQTHERYRPLVWMLAGTGMRWGEATALTVGDVDLTARTVRVVKAWKRAADGSYYVGPTKTRRSRRTIALPNEVVEAVTPLATGRKDRLLFTTPDGGRVTNSGFTRHHWRARKRRDGTEVGCTAGLADPRPRIHDLRHSHVALLIAGGVSLPVIQARLGHEKITTTIDTYGHLLPDLQVAAADAASKALGPAPLG